VAALWQLRRGGDRRRLRVEGQSVRLMVGERVVASAALADCRTDGRTLFIGPRRVVLLQGKLHIFEARALQHHLLSRLGPHQWLGTTALELGQVRESWRRHPWRTALIWLGVIAVAAFLIWLRMRTH